MISTKPTQKLTTEERKKRIQELYEFQMEKFMQENVAEPLFIPKMAYKPATKDEKHITFFASEIERAEYYDVPKNLLVVNIFLKILNVHCINGYLILIGEQSMTLLKLQRVFRKDL